MNKRTRPRCGVLWGLCVCVCVCVWERERERECNKKHCLVAISSFYPKRKEKKRDPLVQSIQQLVDSPQMMARWSQVRPLFIGSTHQRRFHFHRGGWFGSSRKKINNTYLKAPRSSNRAWNQIEHLLITNCSWWAAYRKSASSSPPRGWRGVVWHQGYRFFCFRWGRQEGEPGPEKRGGGEEKGPCLMVRSKRPSFVTSHLLKETVAGAPWSSTAEEERRQPKRGVHNEPIKTAARIHLCSSVISLFRPRRVHYTSVTSRENIVKPVKTLGPLFFCYRVSFGPSLCFMGTCRGLLVFTHLRSFTSMCWIPLIFTGSN